MCHIACRRIALFVAALACGALSLAQEAKLTPEQVVMLRADLDRLSASAKADEAKGDVESLLKDRLELLEVAKKLYGNDDRRLPLLLDEVGVAYVYAGRARDGLDPLEQALRQRQRQYGEQHPETAASHSVLGWAFSRLGDFASAKPHYEQALRIRVRTLGQNDPDTGLAYSNYGAVLSDLGDYAGARAQMEQALRIYRRKKAENPADLAMALSNLGSVSQRLGDRPNARRYLEESLAVHRTAYTEQHLLTAAAYDHLGLVLRDLEEPAAARAQFEKALAIRQKLLSENHAEVAGSYLLLADAYEDLSDDAQAKELRLKALAIRREALGKDHPLVADTQSLVSNSLLNLSDVAGAREQLQAALGIYQQAFGEEHGSTAIAVSSLMQLEATQGNWTAAAQWADRERRGAALRIRRLFPRLSELDQVRYLKAQEQRLLGLALSLAWQNPQNQELVTQSATWLMNSKGLAMESLAEPLLWARSERNLKLAPLVEELATVRGQLSALTFSAAPEGKEEERRKLLAEFAAREAALEEELATDGVPRTRAWVSLDALRKQLPPMSALVEIQRFTPVRFGNKEGGQRDMSPARYLAWVVPPQGDVALVDLGEAQAIDDDVSRLRQQIVAGADGKQVGDLAGTMQRLSAQVWSPLAAKLGTAQKIYLAPDAGLWLLPWNALPSGDGKLVLEAYHLNLLDSARDLIPEPRLPGRTGAAVIFADPRFDLSPPETVTAAQAVLKKDWKPAQEKRITQERTLLPRVKGTPSTLVQATAIKPALEGWTQKPALFYAEHYALESVVRSLQRPQAAVFVAPTFCLPDQPTGEEKNLEHPLVRTGLLLTGCNPRRDGQAGGDDDGILTGVEILGLDLRGTELVVLSASEWGSFSAAAGMENLRQAFQFSGSQAVLSSLWAVPEPEASLLIKDVFEAATQNHSWADSLRSAQLKRLAANRAKQGQIEPQSWAGWVLTAR